MLLKAYAKINLGLDVLRRRPDGYHEVKMIMQQIGIYDEININKINEDGIRLLVDDPRLPANEDNLIYKAAKLMKEKYGIAEGIEIKLVKNIPMAAGLAGGSSDAAAAIKGINEVFGLGLSTEEMMETGVKIGADVPYCIMGSTALSEGIGEKLTRISPCPECTVLIAKPPVGVSTKYVYQNLKLDQASHPDIDAVRKAIEASDIKGIADKLGNILESVTIPLHPEIADIKQMMLDKGALGSLMSGSGPTVFGLYDNEDRAKEAYDLIKSKDIAGDLVLTSIYNA